MSTFINVRLNQNDQFVVTDPDTGNEKVIGSGVLHTPDFVLNCIVKEFFCSQFPGKTSCNLSQDAQDRITSITDFNSISDELRL